MKESELRNLIREIISEQVFSGNCTPSENCVAPVMTEQTYTNKMRIMCPEGFMLQNGTTVSPLYYGSVYSPIRGIDISRCVPNLGNPGDYNVGDFGGHGSPDDPFVPGMGFEDQFIDQITGPGGPFGGAKGGKKGKPIRESKKRRK